MLHCPCYIECVLCIGNCARIDRTCTNGVFIAITSSIVIFLLTSVIMLTVGFVCGHWFYQHHVLPRKLMSVHMGTHTSQIQHQDARLDESGHIQEQDLSMTENVAYVPVSTMT